MRTQDEIVKRIKTRRENDFLGFETSEYLKYLDFEHAYPFLKEDTTEQDWQEAIAEIAPPVKRMHDYMEFAWGKANNERGISANRSIMHCIAWLWLAGEDELLMQVKDEYQDNYHFYGKPILKIICEHFDWDWSQWDDGIRSNGRYSRRAQIERRDMTSHYILDGKEPVEVPDVIAWATQFEMADRIVEQTNLDKDVRVSTVFLGLDHQFGDGPPLLFETMVFGGERDQDQWRYSTWDEAAAGHTAVVASLTKRHLLLCANVAAGESEIGGQLS